MSDDIEEAYVFDPSKVMSKQTQFKVPDVVGTVQGWRAWDVLMDVPRFGGPRLQSVTHKDYLWEPRELSKAECNASCGEDIPGNSHGCGFYSAKTLAHLMTMSYYMYDPDMGYFTIVGQVANWGKVIEGSQGWRAEKAYPTQLYVPYEAWKIATPLSETYGVPVKLQNTLSFGR